MPGHTSTASVLINNKDVGSGSINRKREVEIVGERVTKTKKEIEHLKVQLQKLINDGINASENKPDKTASSGMNGNTANIVNNPEVDEIKAKTFKDNIAEILNSPKQAATVTGEECDRQSVRPKNSARSLSRGRVRTSAKNKSPEKPAEEQLKKVRHYDKEAARQYIKKQREKRKESMKTQTKETAFTQDLKKQRLQELHQKSMQLVTQNVKSKRERSRSRSCDTLKQAVLNETKENTARIPQENIPKIDDLVPNLVFNEAKSVPSRKIVSKKWTRPQLKNITIRSPQAMEDLSAIRLDVPQQNNVLDEREAAKRIQKAYRRYRQRKLRTIESPPKQTTSKEVQTSQSAARVPVWLQTPTALPYPYNFISAVKRKLNLAVQQIATSNGGATGTTDAAVQSSLAETVADRNAHSLSLKSESQSKNRNTDLKSFLSHKCLDLDLKTVEPLKLTKKSDSQELASDSDTSKNVPEISSESSLMPSVQMQRSSNKRSHSSDTDERNANLSLERVKKLKHREMKSISLTDNREISEHISNRNGSENGLSKLDVDPFSRRDSIITYNRSSYSQQSKSTRSNRSKSNTGLVLETILEPVSNINLNLNNLSVKTSAEISSEVTTDLENENNNKEGALNSFRSYIKSFVSDNAVKSTSRHLKVTKSSETDTRNASSSNGSSTIRTNVQDLSEESNKENDISLLKKPDINLEVPLSRSDASLHNNKVTVRTAQDYSNSFTSATLTVSSDIPALTRPSVSLQTSRVSSSNSTSTKRSQEGFVTNIVLQPGEKVLTKNKMKSNEIHLKFEAELHLLNEFNDSLRQVMAVEKSLLELHNNNDNNKKVPALHTRDTQTSIVTRTASLNGKSTNESSSVQEEETQIPTINYSRGSEVTEEEQIDSINFNNSTMGTNNSSISIMNTTGLELSHLKDNLLTSSVEESNVNVSVSLAKENHFNKGNVHAGLSLEMFEQLIKDEDARIENLKTILKIREKALVDRTKGELAWLEIQKRHLRDSGQLQQISAIKKKQRGLLIKLEHERHEMQRLKQMQKAASKERKSALRERRNMIKAQLSTTGNMIAKIKRNNIKEERRSSGPLKVYNIKSHSESIRSETSMSRKSSVTEEVISVVSHAQSIVSHVTTMEEAFVSTTDESTDQKIKKNVEVIMTNNSHIKTESVKRSLLMREAALQKRRKEAEELLQWHQRLLEEEGKIAELELAASAIINQIPTATTAPDSSISTDRSHKFKGSQLNLLWHNMTGRDEKKFDDHLTYTMSKMTFERFCKDAKRYALNRNQRGDDSGTELTRNKSDSSLSSIKTALSKDSIKSNRKRLKSSDEKEYTSDFESLISHLPTHGSGQISPKLNGVGEKIVTDEFTNRKVRSSESSDVTEIIDDEQSPKLDESSEAITTKTAEIHDTSSPVSSKISEETPSSSSNNLVSESGNLAETNEVNNSDNISARHRLELDRNYENSVKSSLSGKDETIPFNNSNLIETNIDIPSHSKLIEEMQIDEGTIDSNFTNDEAKTTLSSDNVIKTDQIKNSIEPESESNQIQRNLNLTSVTHNHISELDNVAKENVTSSSLCKSISITSESSALTEDIESTKNFAEDGEETEARSDVFDEGSVKTESEDEVKTEQKEISSSDLSEYKTDESKTPEEQLLEVAHSEANENQLIVSIEQNDNERKIETDLESVKSTGDVKIIKGKSLSEVETTESAIDITNEICTNKIDEVCIDKIDEVSTHKTTEVSPDNTNEVSVEETNQVSIKNTDEIFTDKTHERNELELKDAENNGITEDQQSNDSVSGEDKSSSLSLSYGFIEKKPSDHEQAANESTSEIKTDRSESEESSSKKNYGEHIDVKKRVSEILADANLSSPRGDKSPRLQDLYTTAYDVVSPEHSPESGSPTEIEQTFSPPNRLYRNDEVEELLKKQLAIEQEIKEIQQQQQKEQLPYMYVREIPNKPPPPYKPPIATAQTAVVGSILPTNSHQIRTITSAVAAILHNAYISGNLQNITLSKRDKKILHFKSNVEKNCYEFVFDLSKDIAVEYYKQFEPETGPSWMHLTKKTKLALGKPLNQGGLEKLITKKIRQLLGYEIVKTAENIKCKWSSKKRDHVDELLVVECQAEETEWTNYDRDELIVKDELTKDIMNMLLSETAQVFNKILAKKAFLC